jgi:MFS family permease
MVPQVISLLQRTFVGVARVKALGAYTAVLSSGMVVGQVLGGVLVSADVLGTGWRAVFAINVPIGAVLMIAGVRLLPQVAGTPRGLDLPGLLALSATVFLLVVPLVMGHQEGWPLWGWLMLGGSAVAAVTFVAFERWLARRGGHPLIRGRVLTSPGLALAAGSMLLVMAGVSGFMFSFTLYLQGGLGESALRVGLTFAPMAAGFGIGSVVATSTDGLAPLPADQRPPALFGRVRRAGRLGLQRTGHPGRARSDDGGDGPAGRLRLRPALRLRSEPGARAGRR